MIERPRNLDINLSKEARPFNEAPFSIFLGGFRQFLRKRPKQSSTMEMRLTLEQQMFRNRSDDTLSGHRSTLMFISQAF